MKKIHIVLLLIVGIVLIGCTNQRNAPTIKKEAEQVVVSFKEKYPNVADNHPFKEVDIYNILDVFEKKQTAIIFIAYPDCPKCQQVIKPLGELALVNNVSEIKYYDALAARDNDTAEYRQLTKVLELILPYNDQGESMLMMPLILFVDEGNIISYHQGSVNSALPKSKILDDLMTSEFNTIIDPQIKNICLKDC